MMRTKILHAVLYLLQFSPLAAKYKNNTTVIGFDCQELLTTDLTVPKRNVIAKMKAKRATPDAAKTGGRYN